jgi:hypothetical protein
MAASSVLSYLWLVLAGLAVAWLVMVPGRQLRRFYRLRAAIAEALILAYPGVGSVPYDTALETLRGHAAALAAWRGAGSWAARLLLWSLGYDLARASAGLAGVLAVVDQDDAALAARALHGHQAELGLKLPRSFSDDEIAGIAGTIE